MNINIKIEDKFEYIEEGKGNPVILLHGLMGGLSNFDKTITHLSNKGYKVLVPQLPLYKLPILKASVRSLSKFLRDFIDHKAIGTTTLIGNSLGGHIGLLYATICPNRVNGLVLTGSSGLFENSMGATFPRRNSYDYIKRKTQEVFYDPSVATDELIENVVKVSKSRQKLINTLAISKNAIRHNMSKDLPNIGNPVCLIWGKNDIVTPPEVAEEFHRDLPNSQLYWIDKCGHAPMMEHPEEFNTILDGWMKSKNLIPNSLGL